MRTFLAIFVLLLIFLVSCNNPIAITPDTTGKNVVTGIIITNETSPQAIRIWGTPNTNYPKPPEVLDQGNNCNGDEECSVRVTSFAFETPYPNPSDANFTITYQLPATSEVTIWIESAYWVGEDSIIPFKNIKNRPFQKFILLDKETQVQGRYALQSGLKLMCSGGQIHQGFYRVFIQTSNGFLSWKDVYFWGSFGTNPKGLEPYYPPCYKE